MNLTAEQGEILSTIMPGVILMLIISMFGFFGNFTIVIATINSKKLKSKCNVLIAMLAVSDFITQLAHLPYGYFALTGTLVQRLDFCHIIMTPSLISMNFGTSLIWMIGLDRLLSVMYPAG
uniref:G-protein coupled receptors family 1 profile domain-containing protein n=1 Tax=Plectus sambesii TaxID=2011161 RepID=A0A914W3V6_9BILA